MILVRKSLIADAVLNMLNTALQLSNWYDHYFSKNVLDALSQGHNYLMSKSLRPYMCLTIEGSPL